MLELSEEGRRVVEALVAAPLAWQSPAELARATGSDLEITTDLLAALDVDGWLVPWERLVDVVVTLSAGAAARLGVRLVESGRDEQPRWARLGDPEPPMPRASGVFRDERAASLERVVDPHGEPEIFSMRLEAAIADLKLPTDPRDRAFVGGLPLPTLLVGQCLTPWPGPGDGRKASCPSCRSKRLGPSMYCLYCDRWGLDHLLREAPAPRTIPPRSPEDDAKRRDLERQARKSKRRARRFAQSSTQPTSKGRPRRPCPLIQEKARS